MVDLWREPGTGYEIAKRFQEGFGFSWKASHPQIYTELKKIADLGWAEFDRIEQDDKPAKKVYTLTPEGVKALIDWVNTPVEPAPIRDAFFIKIAAGALADPVSLREEVFSRKALVDEKLHYFKEVEKIYYKHPEKLPPQHYFPYLALRAGILTFENYEIWFQEVIDYLDRLISEQHPDQKQRATQ
jgi:PadR family transcriptional regulator AphA